MVEVGAFIAILGCTSVHRGQENSVWSGFFCAGPVPVMCYMRPKPHIHIEQLDRSSSIRSPIAQLA